MTMTLISTVTVGAGGATGIAFSSIPQSYTDLMITFGARSNAATTFGVYLTVNNLGTSIYSWRRLWGNGSTVGSESSSATALVFSETVPGADKTTNTFGNVSIYLPNYTDSTSNQLVSVDGVYENNATAAHQNLFAGLAATTSAITSISLDSQSGSFVQYSTASLYGILKGSGGATVA